MFGKNPIRKAEFGDGEILQIQEIFPTLQGEGPYAGHPAIFIRLGGCNLACSFCDTEFENFEDFSVGDILSEIKTLSSGKNYKLIVITGGEPFRQPIELLCEKLIDLGFIVQIETNGTIYREKLSEDVKIICSPKNTGNGYQKIRDDLLHRLDAVKFIISKGDALYNNISEVGQSDYNIPVYIQPMDEYDEAKNQANIDYCVNLAQEKGIILSLQTHKYLGVR